MTAVITPNSLEGEKSPAVPFKENEEFYSYIMYFDGNSQIAYADELDDLIELLIPDYQARDEEQKLDARLKFALEMQTIAQTSILAGLSEEQFSALQPWEVKVLEGAYNEDAPYAIRGFWKEQLPEGTNPSEVPVDDQMDVWANTVPLTLIDVVYAPWSDLQPPLGNPEGSNIVWLRAAAEQEFLESLANVGYIAFGSAK